MSNIADKRHSLALFNLNLLFKQAIDRSNSMLLISELLIFSSHFYQFALYALQIHLFRLVLQF